MTEPSAPRESVAVSVPSETTLEQQVRASKRPVNAARIVSSGVSGCATLLFGALTAFLVVLGVGAGNVAGALVMGVVLGAFTAGFGFLTWRWARGLPPSKTLVLTEHERDELE